MITRHKVESDNEFTLLSHMIMNREVLAAAYSRYKSKELKTKHFTKYFRPVAKWLFRYYAKYEKAPKKTIRRIYDDRKRSLSEESQEIVETYLERLADEYAEYEEVDVDYIQGDLLTGFIRQKELEGRLESAQQSFDSSDFEGAEEIFSTYEKVRDEEEDETLGTIIPFTEEDVDIAMQQSSKFDAVYNFEGDLNRLVGPLERSWLVAISGNEKSSKSFVLNEIGYQAAFYQKKRVLIINLELNKKMIRSRNHRRISKTAREFDAGKIISPIIDCENNQNGTCQVRQRMLNRRSLFRTSGEVVNFLKRRKTWKVCTKCRGKESRKNASKYKRFIPAIWFERERIRETTEGRIIRAIDDRSMRGLKNLRIKCFPRYSVTFDETYDYIRRYIDKTGWEPHIIMWDYLDILADEGVKDTRIDIDRKWKKASKTAGELDCLVFTADQATKASRKQRNLDQMSTSESKTKDSHLDVRIAINQTEREKELSIMRMTVLFHRHQAFNINSEAIVTQRLTTSEAMMDNAIWYKRDNIYNVEIPIVEGF